MTEKSSTDSTALASHSDRHDATSDTVAPLEKLDETIPASAWSLPDMAQPGRVVQSAWKEKAKAPPPQEKIEVLDVAPEGEPPKGLTVQELTEISDQAQKEGFEAGHKEGLESGKTEGYNAGFDAGSKKAYQQTLQKLEDEKARLQSIATALLQPMQNQSEQLEQAVVDIALNLAQKLVKAHIQAHPDALFYLVQKTINSLPAGKQGLQVYLNQADADLLHTLFESDAGAYQDIQAWDVQIDNQLANGGCTVKTKDSFIDLRIDKRINNYLQQLPATLVETPEPLLSHPGQQAIDALASDVDNTHVDEHDKQSIQSDESTTSKKNSSSIEDEHDTHLHKTELNTDKHNKHNAGSSDSVGSDSIEGSSTPSIHEIPSVNPNKNNTSERQHDYKQHPQSEPQPKQKLGQESEQDPEQKESPNDS